MTQLKHIYHEPVHPREYQLRPGASAAPGADAGATGEGANLFISVHAYTNDLGDIPPYFL